MAGELHNLQPVRFDHELIIGDTYRVELVLEDEDTGAAIDLSAVTAGTVKLRTEPGGVVLLTPSVSLADKATGKIVWSSPNTTTDDLQPGTAVYALQLVSDTYTIVVEGRVVIRRAAVV
jgi:hypothetical protein